MNPVINPIDRKKGFTLTELLIVIVIIAVLAAVLVPTVTSMKDRAAATGCAANMRQCIALSLMFTSEQNGRLPRLHANRNIIQSETGKNFLPVEERTVTNPNTSWWPDLITTYAEGASMFACPKLKENATKALSAGAPSNHSPLGIGINYPTMAPDSLGPPVSWVRLDSVPDLGRVVWFADAACTDSGGEVSGNWKTRKDAPGTGSCLFRGYSTEGKAAIARHGGKINVGFADGHVALVDPKEINWGGTKNTTDRSKYVGYTKFP